MQSRTDNQLTLLDAILTGRVLEFAQQEDVRGGKLISTRKIHKTLKKAVKPHRAKPVAKDTTAARITPKAAKT
ncbi:MAG TPA: hypothetical protein VKB67_04225 [Rhizomicrobium sp.]|nr:hypothetical protein [Rhizomicrobium sp.]